MPPAKSAKTESKLAFPAGFLWGTATASYQIEGGAASGGRTASIWDTYCAIEGKVANGDSGAVACDHYHKFKDDVKLMKSLGLPAYRFSLSWSRLLPQGRGEVNAEGAAFYNALIDALVAEGIEPLVTLYHWDLPQCLEDEYGGWLDKRIVDDFEHYAACCFELFGDRCKRWLTLNEPWCSAAIGYAVGEHAPGRSEAAATEPYVAGHHLLLAHAKAVAKFRALNTGGAIGITLNCDWREPRDATSAEDVAAAGRGIDWFLGWFAHPIWKGDYPATMRQRCGERLPTFTADEQQLLLGSSDFFGLNHYSTKFVQPRKEGEAGGNLSMWGTEQSGGYFDDQNLIESAHPAWEQTHMGWDVVPWGLCKLLLHIQSTYAPKGGILITENGCAVDEPTVAAAVSDTFRVRFYQMYLSQVHRAIQAGADVRAYFAWSMMDNFEWSHGYTKRFGIVHVDYATQVRTPKASAKTLATVWRTNVLEISSDVAEAALVGEPEKAAASE